MSDVAPEDREKRTGLGTAPARASPVLAAYFARADELRRFLTARTGSQALAEDLLQELYLKLCALRPDYEVVNPGPWLFRMASNLALDHRRSQLRAMARDGEWLQAANREPTTPEREIDGRQALAGVMEALGELPERSQLIFRLHRFDGVPQGEIARRLGISTSAVEKQIASVLKHLLRRVDPIG